MLPDCFPKWLWPFTWMRMPFPPYSCQHLRWLLLLFCVPPTDVKWCPIASLMCVFLSTVEVEGLFIRLLTIWVCSSVNKVFIVSVHFCSGCLSCSGQFVTALYIVFVWPCPDRWWGTESLVLWGGQPRVTSELRPTGPQQVIFPWYASVYSPVKSWPSSLS